MFGDKYIKKSFKVIKYKFEPEVWLNTYDLWIWRNSVKGKKPTPKFKKVYPHEFAINHEMYETEGEEENA